MKFKIKYHEWLERQSIDTLRLIKRVIFVFTLLFFTVLLFNAYFKANRASLLNNTEVSLFSYIYRPKVIISSLILSAVGTLFYVLYFYKSFDFRNEVKSSYKDKNINITKNALSGSSDYMTLSEAESVYTVCDIGKTTNTTFGRLKDTMDKSQRIVAYKPKSYQNDGSGLQNTLILGHSGSGKSFGFVRTEIINAILRGESVIVSDPSGELYTDLAEWCKRKGVNTKILNLNDIDHSDGWNCVSECIDPKTGRLNATKLNMFAEVFIANSSKGLKDSGFWEEQNYGYLKAAIGYASWKRESYIMDNFKLIYNKVSKGLPEATITVSRFNGLTSLNYCEEKILEAAKNNGFDLGDVKYLINKTKELAPKFNIGEVYNALENFDEAAEAYKNSVPKEHPGSRAFFAACHDRPDTLSVSALTGILNKFSLFTDMKLTYNLSKDDISTDDINRVQSIYFLSVDLQAPEMKPISSLFITFLLKKAKDNFNNAQNLANEKGEKNPYKATTVVLDEFYSLGLIGGRQDFFPGYISVSRKSRIHINIILQNITQLSATYGEDLAHTIESNCEMTLVISANDKATCEYVSEFLGGDATVLSETHNLNIGYTNSYTTDDVNVSAKGRKLLTSDETRRFKDSILLVKHGEHPLELDIFPYTLHPVFKNEELKKVAIESAIKSYDEKIEEDYFKELKLKDFDFGNELKYLSSPFVIEEAFNETTGELIEKPITKSAIFKNDTNKRMPRAQREFQNNKNNGPKMKEKTSSKLM